MQDTIDRINAFLEDWGVSAVDILVPLGILFFGWIAAVFIARGARRLMARTSLDERVAELVVGKEKALTIDSARWVSRIVYWIVMMFVLAAFLVRLELAVAAEPINAFLESVFEFAPRLLGAAGLVFAAWVAARIVRRVIRTALERTRVDSRIAEEAEQEMDIKPSQAVAEAAYWLVYLFFLPAILGVLQLEGILRPVEGMLDEFLGFMPNLLSAAVIFVAGWFVARVVQRIVASVLAAAGLDKLSSKYGVGQALGDKKLSELLGLIVHVLIIIPVAIAALGALQLDAVTRPASEMLATMLDALPSVFGAGLVIGISFFIGKFVAGLVSNVLSSAGFDRILVRLGLAKTEPKEGDLTPSRLGGVLVLTAVMLFASIEAAGLLGFDMLADLIAEFIALAGHVALGLTIFGLGLFLGELAGNAVRGSEVRQARLLSTATRVAITILAGAMGLRQMGLANEIIVLAFGLCLGAIAVAVALAFGLGARDEANEAVREWRTRWRNSE